MRFSLSVLILCLGTIGGANAAPITWSSAQDTTSSAATDIIDGGAVVVAFNGAFTTGAVPDVTLDGVTFTKPPVSDFLGQTFPSAPAEQLGVNTTGDADYDTLLNHAGVVDVATSPDVSGANADAVYTISGLTDGVDYLIQVWYTEERAGSETRAMTFGDNEGVPSSILVAGQGTNGFGQFVTGSFTASGTTQDLSILATDAGRSHATALLVREVPEPTSLALLSLSALMCARRRRA
ncbi:MAG: PEP-CTERM sorting domain-containing protein [Planctomycetota bacterium]